MKKYSLYVILGLFIVLLAIPTENKNIKTSEAKHTTESTKNSDVSSTSTITAPPNTETMYSPTVTFPAPQEETTFNVVMYQPEGAREAHECETTTSCCLTHTDSKGKVILFEPEPVETSYLNVFINAFDPYTSEDDDITSLGSGDQFIILPPVDYEPEPTPTPAPEPTKTPKVTKNKKGDTKTSPTKTKSTPNPKVTPKPITTPNPGHPDGLPYLSYQGGLKKAYKSNKLILFVMGFEGCPPCKHLEKDLMSLRIDWRSKINPYLLIHIDSMKEEIPYVLSNFSAAPTWGIGRAVLDTHGRLDLEVITVHTGYAIGDVRKIKGLLGLP